MKNVKLNLSQAWVTKATSETSDDLYVSGRFPSKMPAPEEIRDIVARTVDKTAVREMARRKWFDSEEANDDRVVALTNYVFSRRVNRPKHAFAAMFRRKMYEQTIGHDVITAAWLCRAAEIATRDVDLVFDASVLSKSETVEGLVRLSSQVNGPRKAINYLAKIGIRVVLESSLPGMKTDGACFVTSKGTPVIGLTLRHDRLDYFWFTLLHELAHVCLHLTADPTSVFVDSIEDDDGLHISQIEKEAEADAFAKDSFIPRDAWLRSEAFRYGTEPAVRALAAKFKIHPAIVAGRLRFERKRFQALGHMLGAGEVRKLLLSGQD